jgi:hypothetical protein
MKKVWIKVLVLVVAVVACMSFAGCNDDAAPTPTASSGGASNIKLEGAVSKEVQDKIDFDAYKTQEAYELKEKENTSKIKLLYPVNIFKTDTMNVKYHVEVGNDDNGNTVLEVLGTDFTIAKKVKEIKVEWRSVGLKVLQTEKVYRFDGLCITVDGDVYFYQDEFFSPFVEGRDIAYEAVQG